MSILSILRRVLGFFPKLAKSGLVKSTLLLITLCAMVWFVGPSLRYLDYSPFKPITNRLIAVLVLVFLWGLYNIRLAIHEARTKPKGEPAAEKPRDMIETEIAFLRQSFQNAMHNIRDKWTGKERGSRSLYALPWYLVIGPGPVGKTSLIVDADLKFPLAHVFGQENFKSIRPTGYPQYWVTSESVLFDLPGSWIEQNANIVRRPALVADPATPPSPQLDQPESGDHLQPAAKRVASREARLWQTFMELLTEYRPRRPINGVVLCIDISDLIKASDERRAILAASIHSRLVELAERLGTRFTIYITLTKLDLLTGFQEYFQSFAKSDRTNPFGFSFTIQNELNTDKWVEEFDAAYKTFSEKLNDDLVDRLYEQREQSSRRNIYIFARELAAIGPIVSDFFKRALHADRFSTPPMVRGIYFASTRQEGVPFNALLARVSREYYMPAPIMPAYSGHSLPYFVADLFKQIIFREAGLAGDNKAVERHKRLVLHGAMLASVLALLTFGFYLNEAMRDNVNRADNVLAKSQAFMALPQAGAAAIGRQSPTANAASLSPALNAIRAATEEYPGWRNAGEWRHFASLYEGLRVGPKVEEAYLALLKERYLPALGQTLEQRIDLLGTKEETSTGDERFEALRSYILLGDLGKRNEIDKSEHTTGEQGEQTLMAWFGKDWQQNHEGDKQLQASLNTHLWHALAVGHLTAPLNASLVAAAQAELKKVPRDERLYRSIQALAHRQLPTDVSLRNEIGPSFDKIFQQGSETGSDQQDVIVAAFYTKKAFLDYFVPRNNDLSVLAVEDAWVAGERERVAYSPEDLEAFRKKIRQRYSTDYIDAWTRALSGLEAVDFQNVDHAVAVLNEINGPSNPLGRLLNLIRNQSEIYDNKLAGIAKPNEVLVTAVVAPEPDDNRDQGQRIERSFAQLSQIVEANGKDKPYFEELQGALQKLEAYMREIKSGEASNKPIAMDRAQARANLTGDDPIYVLRRVSANLPAPLSKLLTKIADQCWKVELDAAKKDLQALWQDQVYRQFYVDLATRYPFNKSSNEDVTLDQFTRFFGPKGAFDGFSKDHLAIFINQDTNEPIVIDGRSLEVSTSFIDQLKQVRKIREIFFDASGSPTLHYSLEPLSLSGTAGRSVLNIEGQLVPYSHGPTRPIQILWPNALSSQQNMSQLSVLGTGSSSGTASLTFQGLWSGFRLLDHATVSGPQSDSTMVVFSVGQQRAQYRLRFAGPENPFVTQPLRQLKLPETL